MSTTETDLYNDYQYRMFQEFDEMVDGFLNGMNTYQEVDDVLEVYEQNPGVATKTFAKCAELWEKAKIEQQETWNEEFLTNLHKHD